MDDKQNGINFHAKFRLINGYQTRIAPFMAGDFNCTFYPYEIWGAKCWIDPFAEVIKDIMRDVDLIDLPLTGNCSTWMNGRQGKQFIGKQIDHFVISEGLSSCMRGIRANAEDVILSNHRPISLVWDFKGKPLGFPFKFNRRWLGDEDFNIMIKDYINHHKRNVGSSAMSHFSFLLRDLKIVVRRWERDKLRQEKERFWVILSERAMILKEVANRNQSDDLWDKLKIIEAEYRNFLINEESYWRLKSRATWLE